jgi:tRNA(Ile)-lysidine synthase
MNVHSLSSDLICFLSSAPFRPGPTASGRASFFGIPTVVEESLALFSRQAARDVSTALDMTKTSDHFHHKPSQTRFGMKWRYPLSSLRTALGGFPPTGRYLIGVSGGRDSVALLNLLVGFGYNKLIVCHFNHQLRGAFSGADARFVEKIAHEFGLDCEIASIDVGALAKRSKLSIETAARFARFAFFVEVARRRHCSRIFLAHHADDLVETALLNLFRGASPGGIAAMHGTSAHRIGKTQLTVIRPMLGVWRREIDAYVAERGLDFREDATNRMLRSSRNKIRHRVLPNIEKQFGRAVRKTIWRTAQIWSEEEALLDSLVSPQTLSAAQLAVAALRKMPVALQRRTILRWLRARKVSDVTFDIIENVRSLIQPAAKVAKVNLPPDRHARRRCGKIFVE